MNPRPPLSANHPVCLATEPSQKALPYVSIIMPVCNEAGFIERSLGAVLDQDYPKDKMEVIVADGMSDDGTRSIISEIMQRQRDLALITQNASDDLPRGGSLLLVDNPDRIAPSGLNRAIRQARGEIIVRVDGHALIERTYVRSCVELLISSEVDCVGGALDSVGTGDVGEAVAAVMSSPFGVGGSGFRTMGGDASPRFTDTVPFGAYRRDVFERVGLFNESMVRHQDYQFNYRLRKAGGRIVLLPSVRARYYVRSKLSSLWKQYWQYGIWKGRFLHAYPDSVKLRHLIPPLFVFAAIISTLLAMFLQPGRWILGLILGSYCVWVLAASISLALRAKVRLFSILPAVFGCMHLSWGLGVWVGLLSPRSECVRGNLTATRI